MWLHSVLESDEILRHSGTEEAACVSLEVTTVKASDKTVVGG